jgi:hypothetical protein
MGLIKSYNEFVNENLFGQYSYYGAGSLFPIVNKLASEGKNPEQIYLYLTTLGIDEERKIRVISKVFLNESIDFEALKEISEEEINETSDILKASGDDLAKGIDPSKAKPDVDVKKALDKLKDGETDAGDEGGDEEKKEESPAEDENSKIQALQSALKDAQKLEKIKKILSESLGFDIEGVEEEVLETVLEYHKVLEKVSDAEREKLKPSDFVFPDRKAWPIHDEKHAKTALVWATWPQYKDLKKQVVAAVIKKYPHLKGVGAAK